MNDLFHLVNVLLIVFALQVVLTLPEINSQGFASVSKSVGLVEGLDALLCLLHILVEDVSYLVSNFCYSSYCDLVILQLERADCADGRHLVLELFICDPLWNISDTDVRLELLLHHLVNWGYSA